MQWGIKINNEAKKITNERNSLCINKLTQALRFQADTGERGGCSQTGSGSASDVWGSFPAVLRVTSQAAGLMFDTLPRGFLLPQSTDAHSAEREGETNSWWARMCLPVYMRYLREGLVTCAPSAEGSSAKREMKK